MRLKVSVEQKHIDRGRRGERLWCPIALASVAKGLLIVVITDSISFHLPSQRNLATGEIDGPRVRLPLPTRAKRFVSAFDRRGKSAVKPFKFFVNIPD